MKKFYGEKTRVFSASGGNLPRAAGRPERGLFAGEGGGSHHGAPQGAENAAFSTV
jgi:hypothetical protein